jgi:hypothetical protein
MVAMIFFPSPGKFAIISHWDGKAKLGQQAPGVLHECGAPEFLATGHL